MSDSTPIANRPRKYFGSGLLCLLLLMLSPALQSASLAAFQQAAPPRTPEEIQKDIFETRNQLHDVMPSDDLLYDADQRAKLGPKVVPLMRKFFDLLTEIGVALPQAKAQAQSVQEGLRAMLALLDEKQAQDQLSRLTVSKDQTESNNARGWSLAIRWVKAKKDSPTQERQAKEFAELARSQPDNPAFADIASFMVGAAASPGLAEQLEQVVVKDLTSDLAKETGQRMAANRKIKALLNQPLTIEAVTMDGTKFSTGAWKGKVVLVDFWATWCAPCVAEMPKLKKVYAEMHPRGLEIVGIPLDNDADKLRAFLNKNPEMTWPQLFEPTNSATNPLAEQYGVQQIPTMFLIDRKGVVRSISAHENYAELVAKALEEKP
jgi:thiol-disulfide isomerase/thioredoxin